MKPGLAAVAATQGGLFARHQALSSGYSEKEFELSSRGANSVFVRVRYGVYVTRDTWRRLDEHDKWLLRDRAAILVCDGGTVLSHSSAARLAGLDLFDADDGLVHVTRLRAHGRRVNRVESGVKHHCGHLDFENIVVIDGLPATRPERTVVDLATEFGYLAGLVAADSALRRGASYDELRRLVDQSPNAATAPTRHAVAADADGRSDSPLETLARSRLREIGIGSLQLQWPIRLPDRGLAVVDLYSEALRHVFECDGRTKYRDQVDEQGRLLTAQDVLWREKVREDAIRSLGYGISRLTWADVVTPNVARVRERIWREIRQQNATRSLLSDSA